MPPDEWLDAQAIRKLPLRADDEEEAAASLDSESLAEDGESEGAATPTRSLRPLAGDAPPAIGSPEQLSPNSRRVVEGSFKPIEAHRRDARRRWKC